MNPNNALWRYGLTSLQSRAYVALLQLGAIRATTLSNTIGVARPEAYRVLRELSAKGLVQRSVGSPFTYNPVPGDRAISILLERFSQKLHELEEGKADTINLLSILGSPREDNFDRSFTLITGGGNLNLTAKQLVLGAKSDYVGVISKYGLKRILSNGVARGLVAAKNRRGFHARIISEIDETNVKTANYLSRHFELRRSRGIQYYLDIVDKKTVLIGPAVTDEEADEENLREVDLLTTNTRFVQGMYCMFEQLWKASPRYVRMKL